MPRYIRIVLALIAIVTMSSPGAAGQATCPPTRPDSLGPFYVAGAPERSRTGSGLLIVGTVRSQDCHPLADATVEWWSADRRGEYEDTHRATQRVGAGGGYRYETDFPGRYPGRPPHLHVKVTAPGHRPLVTQLYPAPGQTSLSVDLVLVREP